MGSIVAPCQARLEEGIEFGHLALGRAIGDRHVCLINAPAWTLTPVGNA